MRTTLSSQFTPDQRAAWHPKIVARNTFRFTRDGESVLRLHQTDIVRKRQDGSCILNSGGWKTVTTKDRINRELPPGYSLSQDKGEWYIRNGECTVPYFDGMRVPQDVRKPKAKGAKALHREQVLRRQVRKFVAQLDKLDALPLPNAGDCWFCQMRTQDGKTLGDVSGGDHILGHVNENYLHGSLIFNALEWAGYRNPSLIFHMESEDMKRGRKPDSVKRTLKRYLYRKLGLVS